MSYESTQDFLDDLQAGLTNLPRDERGDWVTTVKSRWIDGVFFNDRQDPMMTVGLQRAANNEEGFEAVLEYEITVSFGATWSQLQHLSMDPQAAIDLGHHLIATGTAAMRDMAKHTWFLSGGEQ